MSKVAEIRWMKSGGSYTFDEIVAGDLPFDGCSCALGLMIVSIACGTLFGTVYGWLIFGLALLLRGIYDTVSERRQP